MSYISRLNQLLHIYDASDLSIRYTAWARRHEDLLASFMVYPVPIDNGVAGLQRALDELVSDRKTFARCLFETHGNAGRIYFNGEKLDATALSARFANRGYEKIFPYPFSRIYFNGCDISDDNGGWDFLDAAGRIFLRLGGGTTFAQTGLGRIPPWGLFTGHIYHFGANTCYSLWLPGGRFISHRCD
jgi:hypothetical protein